MTLYVKGFKIDRQKVADMIKAPRGDPIVDTGIRVVMEQLNRSAYIRIVVGYEPLSADGQCHLALVIALEIDDDEERLRKKELGTIDESIRVAILLWDWTFRSFTNDVSLKACLYDMCIDRERITGSFGLWHQGTSRFIAR
jgi:hypothetical protein